MIYDITSNGVCCGCSGCAQVCPTKAITISENANGFLNAVVNENNCVNCGLCDKVCPVRHQGENHEIRCYAMRLCDDAKLMKSQSGGAFYSIGQEVLKDGGVVYGVSNSKIRDVRTVRVDSMDDFEQLLKSKYVQSDSCESFARVKEDLLSGRKVFYSGTACVVQGLKNFLREQNVSVSNLFTCDLICHGVPSRMMVRDYINYLEKKEGSEVVSHIYRNKERGWATRLEKYTFANGTVKETNDTVVVFSKGYALSSACFSCKFTTPYRESDITIGDFWSLSKIGMSQKQFSHGVSVCIVRNKWLESILLDLSDKKHIELTEVALEDAMQWHLEKSSTKPEKYEKFWMMYAKNRFSSLKPVYFTLSPKEKTARMTKRMIKKL